MYGDDCDAIATSIELTSLNVDIIFAKKSKLTNDNQLKQSVMDGNQIRLHNYNLRWQLCCITFDDDDDVCAPPYGEDLTFNSADCGKKPMIPGLHKEMNKKDYVLEWLMSCQNDWPDFGKIDLNGKQSSDGTTYYPSTTTYTASETKTNDTEAWKLFNELKDINKDLILLSQKLDEIIVLEMLL
ncbi:hypothetical protein AVEN_149281-1 [Araneus ventricosus]|uniref:Uncharacterized protein n=1 Tax=Araneus ventricosus TaxID=182803 RepID=A0A4Y2KSR2_ARAVE|nr:hypothetical protein AVEN_149281-1 [Araneus ventricosus]